jgi:hypothetical protein
VPFSELCADTEAYIRRRYARLQHEIGGLENIKKWFVSRGAESITSLEVEAALSKAKGRGQLDTNRNRHSSSTGARGAKVGSCLCPVSQVFLGSY